MFTFAWLGVLVLQIASWQQWQVLVFGQSILGRKGVVGVLDPGNDDTLGDVCRIEMMCWEAFTAGSGMRAGELGMYVGGQEEIFKAVSGM